jgi:glycosyltransferase involved in cell wall biosynthesis
MEGTDDQNMPDTRIRLLFAVGAMWGGGTERQIIGLLKHIDRTRYRPLLYLIYRTGELLTEVPADVPVFAFDDTPDRKRLWIPGLMHLRHVNHMANCIRREQVDVVYDRTWHMSLVSGEATRKTGTPRISVIVTDPPRDFPATAGRFQRIKFKRLKRSYAEATQLVAVANGVRDSAAEFYGLPAEKIVTSYNFLDLDRLQRLAETAADSPAADITKEFRIVTAGRLHPQKGMTWLLQAVRDLVHTDGHRQIQLDILGDGVLRDELQALVRDWNLESNVTFHGFQSNPIPFFRRSHLFCLPSLFEGMPNSLLEAMASGVPVLSTDCPSGPREILQDGRFGHLVPPASSNDLRTAIADAIGNYEKWKELTNDALQRIEQQFSPAAGIKRLDRLIESVRSG